MNILKIDRGMSKLFWRCERGGGGRWYAEHLEFRRWVQPNSYADRFTANKKLELNMRQSLIEKYSISIMDRNGKDAKKECHHNWPIFFLLFKKKILIIPFNRSRVSDQKWWEERMEHVERRTCAMNRSFGLLFHTNRSFLQRIRWYWMMFSR